MNFFNVCFEVPLMGTFVITLPTCNQFYFIMDYFDVGLKPVFPCVLVLALMTNPKFAIFDRKLALVIWNLAQLVQHM